MKPHSLTVLIIFSRPVFSLKLDFCTNFTMACPSAELWSDREKLYNCPGKKRYTCLMSTRNELREGCRNNITIKAGQTGCPLIDVCDPKTEQPIFVAPHNYLPCPSDTTGCPPRNHSGYSILDIFKYPLCQRIQGDNTSFSHTEKIYLQTTHSIVNTTQKSKNINGDIVTVILVVVTAVAIPSFIFGTVLLRQFMKKGRYQRNTDENRESDETLIKNADMV